MVIPVTLIWLFSSGGGLLGMEARWRPRVARLDPRDDRAFLRNDPARVVVAARGLDGS